MEEMSSDGAGDNRGERRRVRHELREIDQRIHENRNTYGINELSLVIDNMNNLHERIDQPREHAMASNIFKSVCKITHQRAMDLSTSSMVFNAIDFSKRLVEHCNVKKDPTVDVIKPEGWKMLGKESSHLYKRAPSFTFMHGLLSRTPVEMKQRQRRVTKRPEAPTPIVNPQKVGFDDLDPTEQTSAYVERVYRLLKQYAADGDAVDYFEFITHPKSFSQTVENMFYVSFLVKDGLAAIYLDDDQLPVIEPLAETDGAKNDSERKPHQVVVDFSYSDWKKMVEDLDLEEPLIHCRSTQLTNE